VLDVVWISEEEKQAIQQYVVAFRPHPCFSLIALRSPFPYNLPWSQTFYLCCQDVSTILHIFRVHDRPYACRSGHLYRNSMRSSKACHNTIATSTS
jgi:hypothetical protein